MKSTALPRNLADWLDRPAKAIGPRKRLPAMSQKRKREAALYSKKRKAFLEAHPWCEAYETIMAWMWDNNVRWLIDTAPMVPLPPSEEIHHMKRPKQTYFLDERTWLAVCRWSHIWIESHPSTARKLGLLCY